LGGIFVHPQAALDRYPYQPALDGIRALAVCAVLAFHGGVAAVPGGFLGVDAFFVLSGFLITSLILNERSLTGRVDLVAFWGRRVRRLLPALLVVLTTVVLMARWAMPAEELGVLRWDALAALAYVANWRMADRGNDYFATTGAPSPLQHTWSLGIEEQFYLLWPIVLVVLLMWMRLRRLSITVFCLVGATASTLFAAWLYRRDGLSRAYYGTETRAAALLIGCALATLLVAWRPTGRSHRHPVLGSLALAGTATTGLLWALAAGSNAWLYQGGLTVAALAVAAVVGHAVVSPDSPTARFLAIPPLVWIGRISYGLYLWHWPLFGWLTADRTGLTGSSLLALRCASTLLIAVISYLVVEQPIRRARRAWRVSWLRPAFTALAVTAAALISVVATVPAHHALSTVASSTPQSRPSAPPSPAKPTHRPDRKPGNRPRVAFLGDSVSWSLGTYLPPQQQFEINVLSVPGCGIARLPEIRYIGEPHTNYAGCDRWDETWRRRIEAADPDLAVILLDRWELMDRKLDGRYQHIGDPDFDRYLEKELDLALDVAATRCAQVVVLTAPYTRRAERPDGGLWPEDEPARVDAWNKMLVAAAQRHQAAVIDLNARVCPDGQFTWTAGGLRIRSDGLHFTEDGVREWIAPWLVPQLAQRF
jgi:peptidoglycan/LPS O-acetylase OafA/YrhL